MVACLMRCGPLARPTQTPPTAMQHFNGGPCHIAHTHERTSARLFPNNGLQRLVAQLEPVGRRVVLSRDARRVVGPVAQRTVEVLGRQGRIGGWGEGVGCTNAPCSGHEEQHRLASGASSCGSTAAARRQHIFNLPLRPTMPDAK